LAKVSFTPLTFFSVLGNSRTNQVRGPFSSGLTSLTPLHTTVAVPASSMSSTLVMAFTASSLVNTARSAVAFTGLA